MKGVCFKIVYKPFFHQDIILIPNIIIKISINQYNEQEI